MKNQILKMQDVMTSKEIAELTGKRHAHVMRDIRNMVENLNKHNRPNTGSVEDSALNLTLKLNGSEYVVYNAYYKDMKGEARLMYKLNKKACLLLASGYDIMLRAKIIDRWEELETKAREQFQVPTTFAEALRLAAQQQELIEQQQEQICLQQKTIFQKTQLIKEQTPLFELGDAVMKYDDDITIDELAKILNQQGFNIGGIRLRNLFKAEGYLLRNGLPSQKSMNLGIMAIIKTKYVDKYNNTQIYTKPMITGKGQQYFVNKFNKKQK